MITIQVIERTKGQSQKTLWQIMVPDILTDIEVVDKMSRAVISALRKMIKKGR